ncbi:hypothetical protein EXS45_02270 [Candidatus Nomurabacteria bacterium]|nr:hypothetical protein [Candidatus Nomurabacteria bacterium]
MNKNFIVIGGVIFLLIFIFGIFFFTRGSKADELIRQKNKLEVALKVAQNKLNKEKENLETLTKGLQSSFPMAVNVQEQMKKSSSLVRQTDFIFNNPYGSNPELIFKNFKNSVRINNERKSINLILSGWQQKTNLLSVEAIDLAESERIRQDVKVIRLFIENLSEVVTSLTPANSGLLQFQIDINTSRFPSINSVNEVLTSIETAIAVETSSNAGSNPTIVTPADVISEQTIIVETQNQIVALQQQLTQVEEQIQQLSPDPLPVVTSIETPAPTPTPTNSDTENQNTNIGDNAANTDISSIEATPSQGIIFRSY